MTTNRCSSEARRTRRTLASGLAMMFVLLLFGVLLATPAHAATFTVNSTNDPGDGTCNATECTLREAINAANSTKRADTITFNIPGNGPHNISLGSLGLPTITKPVTIDGYTQGDATADTADDATENTLTEPGKTNAVLKIQLDGINVTSRVQGLDIGTNASNTVVKGLVIHRFRWEGISIASGSTGNKIQGNFIGTDPSGTVDVGNGTAPAGAVPKSGVTVYGTNNTIGGASPEARNLISGNDDGGVAITGSSGGRGNKIQGNLIGTDRNGSDALLLGNTDHGVALVFGTTGNRILSNTIFSNNGLGIDLVGGFEDANDVTANDGDDPNTSKPDPDKDTGPNNLQNYPLLTSAQVFEELFGDTTTITGELTSTPSTRKKKRTFTIQFFSSPSADASGFGEGKTFIGQVQVTTNRQGNASFSFTVNQDLTGQYVTATATNNRTGDTSEFSQARVVEEPVIGGG